MKKTAGFILPLIIFLFSFTATFDTNNKTWAARSCTDNSECYLGCDVPVWGDVCPMSFNSCGVGASCHLIPSQSYCLCIEGVCALSPPPFCGTQRCPLQVESTCEIVCSGCGNFSVCYPDNYCQPDCSCAESLCNTQTCSDGCLGTCRGMINCTSPTPIPTITTIAGLTAYPTATIPVSQNIFPAGCWIDNSAFNTTNIHSIKMGNFDLICPTSPPPQPTTTPVSEELCTEEQVDIMLIVDTSGSMSAPENGLGGLTKLSYTKEALHSFVDKLISSGAQTRNNVKLGLVSYNNRSWLEAPLTNDYSIIKQAVSNLSSAGMTCIYCGLKTANENNTSSDIKKVNILMSDGKANIPDFSAESDAVNEANAGRLNGIEYYAISYGQDTSPWTMRGIANAPPEKYYHESPSPEDITAVYDEILNIICN